MKNPANISPKQLKKEKTNIPGLDEILHGELTKGFSYLVSGGTGAGKTILSLQWLLADFTKNDACMYITIAEPASELQANVDGFGWSLDNINILDLSPKNGIRQCRRVENKRAKGYTMGKKLSRFQGILSGLPIRKT